MRVSSGCLVLVLAVTVGWSVRAQEPLPVPKKSAPITKEAPPVEEVMEEEIEPVVVGNLEHQGWVLAGPRGRHYFFGGLAIADYTFRGARQIVTLQQEEPTLLPKPDPHFLYYKELESGHRWAVAREPLSDGSYVVFYQRKEHLGEPIKDATTGSSHSTDTKKNWKEFQRARLEWKKDEGAPKSK